MSTDDKFKIKSGYKAKDKADQEYIDQLHERILQDEASSIRAMILSIDRVVAMVAADLDLISDGEAFEEQTHVYCKDCKKSIDIPAPTSNLTILSDDKNSRAFERVMVIVSKIDDFKKVSDMATGLKPEVVEVVEKVEGTIDTFELTSGQNPLEQAMLRIKQKK